MKFRASVSRHIDKVIVWNQDLFEFNLLNYQNHGQVISFINMMNTKYCPIAAGQSVGDCGIFGIFFVK